MSYSISYSSFDEATADKKWENFDLIIKESVEADHRKEELEKKRGGFTGLPTLSDEEIYNPKFKEEAKIKADKIDAFHAEIEKEIKDLYAKYPVLGTRIVSYIVEQTEIEPDAFIDYLIDLDLAFGGKTITYSSSFDPVASIHDTMGILFPEIDQGGPLNKKDLVFIAKHFEEFDSRFKEHIKELSEFLNPSNEREMKAYIAQLLPLAEDCMKGAQLFAYSDSEGCPDDTLLKERAKKHIEAIQNHSMMKIPLQGYRD